MQLEESGLGLYFGSGQNDKISALAYADDIVLISNTEEKLQKMIDILYHYCRRWRLVVNVSKTKCMSFQKSHRSPLSPISLNYAGMKIEQVRYYKYLGVTLDETLNYREHFDTMAASGSRALGAVLSKTRHLTDLGFMSYEKLISSCVFPVIDYGAEINGYLSSKALEDVQLRAARFYMGLPRSTPLPCLNSEMGWLDSLSRRMYAVNRYYRRLLRMDGSRLPKKVFLSARNSTSGWCHSVRQMLEFLNLSVYWEIQSDVPMELLDFTIREKYKSQIRSEINSMSKLRTYSTLRVGLEVGTQVKCLAAKRMRSLSTQLKCGVLPIRLEVGRYRRELVDERICEVCGKGIEDERHFLLQCEAYTPERERFLKNLNGSNPRVASSLSLRELFAHPFILGKYINNIWDKRVILLASK